MCIHISISISLSLYTYIYIYIHTYIHMNGGIFTANLVYYFYQLSCLDYDRRL